MKKLITYLAICLSSVSFSQSVFERVRTFIEHNEFSKGVALTDSCVSRSYFPDSAFYYKGLVLLKAEKPDEAEKCSQKLQADYPQFAATHFLRGMIYFTDNKYGKSIEHFNNMLKQDPGHIKSLTNRALAAGLLEDYGAAVKDLSEAIVLSPNSSDLYYSRAYWLNIDGREDDAIRDFNHALELDPKNYDAYLGIAQIYHNRKDPAKACETIGKAIEAGSQIADEIKNLLCR